jgi:hypothetical protein
MAFPFLPLSQSYRTTDVVPNTVEMHDNACARLFNYEARDTKLLHFPCRAQQTKFRCIQYAIQNLKPGLGFPYMVYIILSIASLTIL